MSNPNKHQYEYDQDEELEIAEPGRWKVLLLNDDYSTMEFVVQILVQVFKKNQDQAMQIMLEVHKNGKGLCGVYSHEIAEAKVTIVGSMAKQQGYPLRAVMEEE